MVLMDPSECSWQKPIMRESKIPFYSILNTFVCKVHMFLFILRFPNFQMILLQEYHCRIKVMLENFQFIHVLAKSI